MIDVPEFLRERSRRCLELADQHPGEAGSSFRCIALELAMKAEEIERHLIEIGLIRTDRHIGR